MSRLINADEFAKRLNDSLSEYCNAINLGMGERFKLLIEVINAFYKQPTIDAVEVIRCKNCKYFGLNNGLKWCSFTDSTMMDNDFCSCAEKK